jgi:hypothetical protein
VRPFLLLLAGLLAAVEPPPVPDPIGLGERLALYEHLRQAYGLKPAPGVPLAELQAQYAAAWAARAGPVAGDPGKPAREQRLRAAIVARYQVEVDPALDEAGLQDLLHRLDADRSVRDRAAIAELDAAERAQPRPLPDAAEGPAQPTSLAAVQPAKATSAEAGIRPLAFSAAGVTECLLATGNGHAALLVTFGTDHNGAFRGIREGTWGILSQAPAIHRGVLLLGHGSGSSIAGESIAQHLARNKTFYETLGGSAPAAPVECLVLAACAGGGQAQMGAMRAGLGYYPIWRVATGDDASTTALNVLAALQAVAARPPRPSWRGMFRLRQGGEEIVSFGDVGEDGVRGDTTFWRIVQSEGSWRVEEQR